MSKNTPAKKFKAADYKAALKTFMTGDLNAIDEVLATGIPLNEHRYPGYTNAIGSVAREAFALWVRKRDAAREQILKANDICRHLISKGAETYFTDDYRTPGLSVPLEHLFKTGNNGEPVEIVSSEPEIVRLCLDHGADPSLDDEVLHDIATSGDFELFKRLVEDYGLSIEDSFQDGKTVLQGAKLYFEQSTNGTPFNEPIAEIRRKAADPKAKSKYNQFGYAYTRLVAEYEGIQKIITYIEAHAAK